VRKGEGTEPWSSPRRRLPVRTGTQTARRILRQGPIPQRAVRPPPIVVLLPRADQCPSFPYAGELLRILYRAFCWQGGRSGLGQGTP
jgi:hypothetical protein